LIVIIHILIIIIHHLIVIIHHLKNINYKITKILIYSSINPLCHLFLKDFVFNILYLMIDFDLK
jgi:hypothetical protein